MADRERGREEGITNSAKSLAVEKGTKLLRGRGVGFSRPRFVLGKAPRGLGLLSWILRPGCHPIALQGPGPPVPAGLVTAWHPPLVVVPALEPCWAPNSAEGFLNEIQVTGFLEF